MTLEFDEKEHKYSIKGKNLISVSQLIHKYTNDFDADEIIDKMMKGTSLYLGANKDYMGMTKEDIKKVWKINQESKSRYGTYIHTGAEYICEHPECNLRSLGMERPEWKQVKKFFKDTGFVTEIPEFQVFSEELGIAGTMDILLKDTEANLHIGDWKTNLGKDLADYNGDNYTKMMLPPVDNVPDLPFWVYSLQLSFYRYIIEKEYGKNIESLFIVHLVRSKEDLKDKRGNHVTYPEMSRITYKKIDLPYLKAEVNAILNDFNQKEESK